MQSIVLGDGQQHSHQGLESPAELPKPIRHGPLGDDEEAGEGGEHDSQQGSQPGHLRPRCQQRAAHLVQVSVEGQGAQQTEGGDEERDAEAGRVGLVQRERHVPRRELAFKGSDCNTLN